MDVGVVVAAIREEKLTDAPADGDQGTASQFPTDLTKSLIEFLLQAPLAQIAGHDKCDTQAVFVRLKSFVGGIDSWAVCRPTIRMRVVLAFCQSPMDCQTCPINNIWNSARIDICQETPE